MLRSVIVSAVLLSSLVGCVSQVQLANDKGQMAQCSAAGLGIISSLVAASVQHNCVDQYQKQGYHQVPAAAPSATATTSTAEPSAAAKTSTNDKGQATQCNVFGMGIVGSLVAASMQQTCTAQNQKQGSHAVPATTPAAAASTDQAKTK
jgi:uncharacterized membrane protein YeaQ/YmgE (transglycosylase-associated protein family)